VSSAVASASIDGQRAHLEPAAAVDPAVLAELDWSRALHPAMAGWVVRPSVPSLGTVLVRDRRDDAVVGLLDAVEMSGYPGVVNVSIYADGERGHAGTMLEAYGLLVTQLFDGGVRLVHHEVLELNRPIQRILRGIGVAPTARLVEHAYVAGRFWDVLVFAFGPADWDRVRSTVAPRSPVSPPPSVEGGS